VTVDEPPAGLLVTPPLDPVVPPLAAMLVVPAPPPMPALPPRLWFWFPFDVLLPHAVTPTNAVMENHALRRRTHSFSDRKGFRPPQSSRCVLIALLRAALDFERVFSAVVQCASTSNRQRADHPR
jgi:hypothetical protein